MKITLHIFIHKQISVVSSFFLGTKTEIAFFQYCFHQILIMASVPIPDNISGSLVQVTLPPDTVDMILIAKDIKGG